MLLFAITISLSAFLLFLVQPIIAKQILPWFGGSAAVWTTCLVFFQCVLLAGYAYADWLMRGTPGQRRTRVHAALLAASAVALLALGLSIKPAAWFKPDDPAYPGLKILLLLAATIGLPYFVLSTTGPLMQAWFARAYPNAAVYRLYALSNIGSMLALIAYPLWIEPMASGAWQSRGWSIGYLAFAALAGLCTRAAGRAGEPTATAAAATPISAGPPPSVKQQLHWLMLAACGSMLLLTVTTHITQNVASIPFLWVLPLSVYLLSFILCFDGKGWYRRNVYVAVGVLLVMLMLLGLHWRIGSDGQIERALMPITHAVPLYASGLFVLCMFCHGELVHAKPQSGALTRFYLMISAGGALGGLLVGVVAPLVFDSYWEFPIALLLALALAIGSIRWPWRAGIALSFGVALVLAWHHVTSMRDLTIDMQRNFYGTLRVKRSVAGGDDEVWRLMHGVILHGEQYKSDQHRRFASSYYGESSGVARVIKLMREDQIPNLRIGAVGLGTGTLAVYGNAGDVMRFYELNPQVVRLARTRFSFLADSDAQIDIALGDARLSLEREAPQNYDLLVVDAFSGDSIPTHLITREAIRLYERHLSARGAVLFHVSNRYLDLVPIVRQLADVVGMRVARFIDDPGEDSPLLRSDWVMVTRDAAFAQAFINQKIASDVPPRDDLAPWTDDYNNLFEILK